MSKNKFILGNIDKNKNHNQYYKTKKKIKKQRDYLKICFFVFCSFFVVFLIFFVFFLLFQIQKKKEIHCSNDDDNDCVVTVINSKEKMKNTTKSEQTLKDKETYNLYTNEQLHFTFNNMQSSSNNNDIISGDFDNLSLVFLFFFSSTQRRNYFSRKIKKVLNFGTRVAGSFSPGHQKMLTFLVNEGQWQTPREIVFNTKTLLQFPLSSCFNVHWKLEWDNFTASTPFGNRVFFNVVFHFAGGSEFRRKSEEMDWILPEKRNSFAAKKSENYFNNNNKDDNFIYGIEKLRHVVLAAHWDSKYFTDFEFLGACDSVVPVLYLLETIHIITALSDTVNVIRALMLGVESDKICAKLHDALSEEYRKVILYYYADDSDVIDCLSGKQKVGANFIKNNSIEILAYVAGGFGRLLHFVDNLPAISVIFFDGEEAFVEWRQNDNTYGSRHLSKEWKKMKYFENEFSKYFFTRFDSIDLFVLYDLMGTAGTVFHNYFPDQSGKAFALLADIEETHRIRASLFLYCLQQQQQQQRQRKEKKNKNNKWENKENICAQYSVPEVWNIKGQPHDMYTLQKTEIVGCDFFGNILSSFKNTFFPLPGSRYSNKNDNNNNNNNNSSSSSSYKNAKIKRKKKENYCILNKFFPNKEKFAQGPLLQAGFTVEDDHVHWTETRRVLHLIPIPFPSSWHTERDDGSEIDSGTVSDLFGILVEFTLRLGEGWI